MQFDLETHPLVWCALVANIGLLESVLIKINRSIDFIPALVYRRKLKVSLVSNAQLGDLTLLLRASEMLPFGSNSFEIGPVEQ